MPKVVSFDIMIGSAEDELLCEEWTEWEAIAYEQFLEDWDAYKRELNQEETDNAD